MQKYVVCQAKNGTAITVVSGLVTAYTLDIRNGFEDPKVDKDKWGQFEASDTILELYIAADPNYYYCDDPGGPRYSERHTIPEPGALYLVCTGLGALAGLRRKRLFGKV